MPLTVEEKENEKKRRNAAGSASLPDHDDAIVGMINIGGTLHLISNKSIHVIREPNQVDPDIAYKNVPWVLAELMPLGAKSDIIARTFLQFHHIAGRIDHENLIFEKLAKKLSRSVSRLADCFFLLEAYEKEFELVQQTVAQGIKSEGSTLYVSTVKNYEHFARSFFHSAKAAMVDATRMYTLSSQFKVSDCGNVTRLIRRFSDNDSLDTDFAEEISKYSDVCKSVIEIRNAIEHPKSRYFVEFRNVEFLPSGHLHAPAWRMENNKCKDFEQWQDFGSQGRLIISSITSFVEISILYLTTKLSKQPDKVGFAFREASSKPDTPTFRYECNLVPPG
jgi:hypothetical protein